MNIKVTPQDLRETAQQLQNGSQQINSTLATLKGRVDALQSIWQGQAHTQYNEYYQQWNQAAIKLNEALNNLSQLTTTAANQFEEADQNIGRMFQAR
ncbi:WXG100 family type VII secretion target [Tumebacillus sp. DT12]|uniref:ESAT-6-like protein n=1 Tax=Tumebacillus lacus TaxID=2995335 RepID=A0ABT3X917_9BACL|nr:WXG100 family type VII secretion target [Tumebacillus lacus]MCX7572110.1 WXG100 family type VII secretion target [Tumebacillus lacus]